jgi:surface antigen/LysM repeat protein
MLHMPLGADPALAKERSASVAYSAGAGTRLVDGVAWSESGALTVPLPLMTPVSTARRDVITYRAKAGDTLRGLAATYGLSVNTLIWSNPNSVDRLSPGQTILIPPVDGVLVMVAPGDSVHSLALKYSAEEDAIIEFNLLRHPESLIPGQYLMIPYGVGPQPPAPPKANPRTIAAGHRNWAIYPIYSGGVGSLYPFGQCTWYVNTRRPAPWGGNAWQWYGRARAWGRPVGATPRVGAIMVTWENPYWGHVAYVEQVYGDGSWLVSEMNYYGTAGGGWGRVSYRHVIPGTIPLIGFIY